MKFFVYIGIAMLVCVAIAIGLTYIFSKSFEEANDIQRYEVVTDSNTVTIHTHMPIDSVEFLLGKPQKYHTYSIAGSEYHTYEYILQSEDTNKNLKLEFKDNILFKVEQR